MSNDYSMQTSVVEGIHDEFTHFDHHRESITPMCKASFSTERFRDSFVDLGARSQAAIKNKRLVTILKEKIFKGFAKLKQKKVMVEEPIIAINSRVWKVSKKSWKKKNSTAMLKETIRSSSNLATDFMEIKRMHSTIGYEKYDSEGEDRNVFITDKHGGSRYGSNRGKHVKLPSEEEKKEMLLKRILNNNFEEGKCYSLLNFRPFEIKRPAAVTHYNVNRLRLENEMLDHADDVAKTTQSEFLFKISRPVKEDPTDTSKNVNFKTNPGLIRSVKKYTMISTKEEEEGGDVLLSQSDMRGERNVTFRESDNHIDRMKKIAGMREKLNKKITKEKSRYHYLKVKEDEIKQELEKLAFLECELGSINKEDHPERNNYMNRTVSHRQGMKLKPITKQGGTFTTGHLKTNIYSNKQSFNQLKDVVLLKEAGQGGEKKYEAVRDKTVVKILNNIHPK
jgi:hypothetical protein